MVTIVHIYNRWKNSELRCYVNGELASYGEITWFVNTSDVSNPCVPIPIVDHLDGLNRCPLQFYQ